jgi:ketosteroid isomerase-like protein
MKMTRTFFWVITAALGLSALSNLPAADVYKSEKDEKDLAKTSQDWNKAMLNADTTAMEKILSDDYTFIDPSGMTITKEQEIASYKDGSLKFESVTPSATKTRMYVGGAVVTGTVSIKGKYKTDDISGDYRFVEVYEPRKGGGWQAVFAQITKVPEKK